MKEIEIRMRFKLLVDPKLELDTVHRSVKEWIKKSTMSYEIEGEKFSAPVRLQEIETSSENHSYITQTKCQDDGKEENHIKTKIHVP